MRKALLFSSLFLGYINMIWGIPGADSVYRERDPQVSSFPGVHESMHIATENPATISGLDNLLFKDIPLLLPRKYRNEEHVIRNLMARSNAEYSQGHFDKSIAYLQKALQYCHPGQTDLILQIYNRIANCYTVQGRYSEAADNYYKALSTPHQNRYNTKKANIYNNLSVVWFLLGETQKSLYYLTKAETIAIIEKDTLGLSNILNRKGNLYLQMADTANAFNFYTNSLLLARKCDNKATEALASINLAFLYMRDHKTEKAQPLIAFFRQSIEDKDLNIFHRLSMRYSYGEFCFTFRNYSEAEKAWVATEQEALSLNAHLYRLKPLLGLSNVYARGKQFDKAIAFRQLYNILKDSIVSAKNLQEANVYERKFQMAQKEKEIALHKLKVEQQRSAAFKQNILVVTFGTVLFLLFLIYFMIKRNNRKQLLLDKEQTSALQKEMELNRIKAIMEGEEKERSRVALELHDGVGSMLSMAKLNLSVVYDQYKNDQRSNDFRNVLQLLDQSSAILRNTAHSLVPDILLHSGIDNGLNELCRKMAQLEGVSISYQAYGLPPVNKSQERNIFRLLRDIMKVVIQYSKPSPVLLQLNWQGQWLYVTIEAFPEQAPLPWAEIEATATWRLLEKKIEAMTGTITLDHREGEATVWDIEFEIEEY